ncbi:MAG: hypothetical protein KGL64_08360, partial [Acidobacteriota bacterium]|nr:hypothetical protein [Acidobacteriota bacterium]
MILHARKRCAVTHAFPWACRAGIVLFALLLASRAASAIQPATDEAAAPLARGSADTPCPTGHVDIERLNYLGADLLLPAFSDTITGAGNPVRRDLLCHDLTYRLVSNDSFAASPQSSPVTVPSQIYVGQRPTWTTAGYII